MSEAGEDRYRDKRAERLPNAIRLVKNAAADRDDVVVEMRDAIRGRLEILAGELGPVFEEASRDNELFDFAISSGLQPRLWIDAVAHVAMGRDKRSYRFVRDGRRGRVVIAESANAETIADKVTIYIAERLVERQRQMEGPIDLDFAGSTSLRPAFLAMLEVGAWHRFLAGLGLFLAGAAAGMLLIYLLT